MTCKKPKKLAIELYTTGELGASETEDLKAHLSGCDLCHGHFEDILQQREAFLSAHPYPFASEQENTTTPAREQKRSMGQALWPGLAAAGESKRPISQALWPALAPLLGIVLLSLCLLPFLIHEKQGSMDEIVYKSGSSLAFLVKRQGEIKEGDPLGEYGAGDVIQVLYNSKGGEHLTLFSLDSRGTLSFYHNPDSMYCSIQTKKGTRMHYPGSIQLDASPGHELIVGLFTPKPRKERTVRKWAAEIQEAEKNLPALGRKFNEATVSPGSSIAILLLKKGG